MRFLTTKAFLCAKIFSSADPMVRRNSVMDSSAIQAVTVNQAAVELSEP